MDTTALDLGLLILRVGLAIVLFAHSTQKLFSWFSGSGPAASAALFEKLGQHPGKPMVYLAATCEMAAAVSMLLGFLTPVGAAVGVGTMVVAGSSLMLLNGSFWNSAGGGEYPFVLALVLAALAFTGPGSLAVDPYLSLPLADRPVLVGVLALVLGLAAAVPPVQRARSSRAVTL